jgi:hypothetical protein
VAKFIDRRIIKTGNKNDVLSLTEIAREYKNWCAEMSTKTSLDLIDAQNIISSSSLADDFDKSGDNCTLTGYIIGNATTVRVSTNTATYASGNKYNHVYVPLRFNQDEMSRYFDGFGRIMQNSA